LKENLSSMSVKAIFVLVAFATALNVSSQICSCNALTPKTLQRRSDAKHVANYDDFFLHRDTIGVKYIYRWQKKYKAKTDIIKTNPANPASRRQHDTPEDSLYILKGFMWFVKQEDNDCDLHMEIGTEDSADIRIVVEVPKENKSLQNKIFKKLESLHLKIMNCTVSTSKKAHFTTPIPVIVTGLGFYDASHKPDTNHGDAHSKKYSWELHPVKEIIFE
jgi:hypothetical protein